jgi:hypothetical protein
MFIDYEGNGSRINSQAGIGETFADVLRRRLSRRSHVQAAGAAGIAAATLHVTGPRLTAPSADAAALGRVGSLGVTGMSLDTGPSPIVTVRLQEPPSPSRVGSTASPDASILSRQSTMHRCWPHRRGGEASVMLTVA